MPDLLAAALRRDPSQPLVTYYDDATGERVELSRATAANWVAKSANLLRDGLEVEPGEPVALLLPAHWQSAVLLLACWALGAVVIPAGADLDAAAGTDVIFASDELLPAAQALGARDVVGLSLLPMGARLPAVPPGVLDFAAEVPAYGDHFAAVAPVDGAAPAVRVEKRTLAGAELVEMAVEAAAGVGLGDGDRVLSTLPFDTLAGLMGGLLAPLAAGAGAVLCRHLDPAGLDRRLAAERVGVLAGIDRDGNPAGNELHRLDR
ncbi:MAG: TIGR03089 family protein [Mycobacteriales bacterium]